MLAWLGSSCASCLSQHNTLCYPQICQQEVHPQIRPLSRQQNWKLNKTALLYNLLVCDIVLLAIKDGQRHLSRSPLKILSVAAALEMEFNWSGLTTEPMLCQHSSLPSGVKRWYRKEWMTPPRLWQVSWVFGFFLLGKMRSSHTGRNETVSHLDWRTGDNEDTLPATHEGVDIQKKGSA